MWNSIHFSLHLIYNFGMSVSDELNGFKFQYHVVLVLFLDDPASFVAIGSEKQGEDCALKTRDNRFWLAQCKYSSNRNSSSKKLMLDGLQDLKKHQRENVEKLILATNIYHPFCKNTLFSSMSSLHVKRFDELHSDEKAKLKEYAKGISRKKPFAGKFNLEDLQNVFSYAYCNFDRREDSKTNIRYLVDKIRELIDGKPEFNAISPSCAARDWLRKIECDACSGVDSLLNEERMVSKGCLAGAFCNSTLFQKRYSEVAREINFEDLKAYENDLDKYCDEHREDFIEESIDSSYSVIADYYDFSSRHGDISASLLSEYVGELELDSRTPKFIVDSFEEKGDFRKEFQLAIYRYYAACVIQNCGLVQTVRKEFGCDN